MTDSMRPITIEIPLSVVHRLSETFEGTPEDAALAGLKLINGMGQTSYNNLLELAKQLNTTPAKTLRTAIDLLIKDSAHRQLTHGTVGRPKTNEARDAKLYEFIKAGATHAEAAAKFSLSVVRVGQIAAMQRIVNGEATRRGRAANPRKIHGGPNLMRMYDEIDGGMSYADAAQAYELDEHRVRDLHSAYSAQLADKPKVTAFDRLQAAHQATLTPEARLANSVEAQLQAAEIAAKSAQARADALEAQALVAEAKAQAAEVLTLKVSDAPRKLAVIPPSMKNPELFPAPKEIKPVDLNNLDNRIFDEDFDL